MDRADTEYDWHTERDESLHRARMEMTVVVVGSGPWSGNRTDIDGHPVVRMWNHEWQPADRYGTRYDYGLITIEQDARCASRCPAVSWFFYNTAHEPAVSEINGGAVVTLKHHRWLQRATELGARPGTPGKAIKFTRGFAAVAGAIDQLRPGRVVIIGMDLLRDGATPSKYYDPAALPYYVNRYPSLAKANPAWAADTMPEGWLRDGPHDYSVEAVLIRALAAEAGTEIAWGF